MSSIITIKRGATLEFTFTVTNTDGSAANLSAATMTCMIRDAEENLVAQPTPTATATPGTGQVYLQDSSAFPLGLLRADIEIVVPGGAQVISDTFGIEVLRSETQTLPEQAPFNPVTTGLAPPETDYGWDPG